MLEVCKAEYSVLILILTVCITFLYFPTCLNANAFIHRPFSNLRFGCFVHFSKVNIEYLELAMALVTIQKMTVSATCYFHISY